MDLSTLNNEQQKAVLTTEGYIRVIASPGSGKTRALSHRFAYIIDQNLAKENEILCVTYTNKAADEMKERIKTILDDDSYSLSTISTIHSYCTSFLRANISSSDNKITKSFEIFDEETMNRIIRKSFKDNAGIKLTTKELNLIKAEISSYKTNNIDYVRYLLGIDEEFIVLQTVNSNIAYTIRELARISRIQNGLFFDDLICLTRYILANNKSLADSEKAKYKYILVDEFQDTSYSTYELIRLLSSHYKNLFVVGDIDQSIYSFIQAEPNILLKEFIKDFPNAITLTMDLNYRSTEEIIDSANTLIQNNSNRYTNKLTVSATHKKGIKPIRTIVKDSKEEPEHVLKIINHLHNDLGHQYSDIFVIGRNNFNHTPIIKLLKDNDIPVIDSRSISRSTNTSPVVEKVLNYIYFAKNNNAIELSHINKLDELGFDEEDIDNAIGGKISVDKLLQSSSSIKVKEFLTKINQTKQLLDSTTMKPSEILITTAGIHNILVDYDIENTSNPIVVEAQPLAAFINDVKKKERLNSNYSLWDIIDLFKLEGSMVNKTSDDGVRFLTAHGSKGLESKDVIIFGKDIQKINEEEQRRLAYVAITRAKEYLFIVSPANFSTLTYEIFQKTISYEDYIKYEYSQSKNPIELYGKELNDEKKEGLKTLIKGENVFLTGEAGTGKTFLIDRFLKYLIDQNKSVLICCPTGIASNNYYRASTIHSAFNLTPHPSIIYRPQSYFDNLNKTCLEKYDVLIIDEISMVRIDMFEYIMKLVIAHERKTNHHIQVIVCGDFFQLPPVVRKDEEALLKQLFPTFVHGFAFESPIWDTMSFKNICLKEIFRQNSKDKFVECLNNLRKGKDIDESLDYINSHAAKNPSPLAIELHARNEDVTKFNNAGLAKLSTNLVTYTGKADGTITDDISVEYQINIKPGCRVMLLRNNTKGIPYQNGTLGSVIDATQNYIDILIDNSGCIRLYRKEHECYEAPKLVNDIIYQKQVGTINQFPIKLAYAITIHKSQGQTYELVNLNPDGWENGQLYVALSRIKSIKGLYLYKPLSADVIKTSQEVIAFYNKINK